MELRTVPKTIQIEPRINNLLKKCRQFSITLEELILFLRMHYLYEPDETEAISKSLAYLADYGDFTSMGMLLTALQTINLPLLAIVSLPIFLETKSDYLMGHVLHGYQHNTHSDQESFRHIVQVITEIWRKSDHNFVRPAIENTIAKAWPKRKNIPDQKRRKPEHMEMAFVICQIGSTHVMVHDAQLRKKIADELMHNVKTKDHLGVKSWLAIRTDDLTDVALMALTELRKELQKKQIPGRVEEIVSHYNVQEIFSAVTPAERQLSRWRKVEEVAANVLWIAIQKSHFPSFYSLRHGISPTILIKALSLQLQQVDQPQAVIHLMIGSLMATITEGWLTKDERVTQLAQEILNKALLCRNRQAISAFIKIKKWIPSEYILRAQKCQEKALLATSDPIHLIVEDLTQTQADLKSSTQPNYFKEIVQQEMAIVCQLYRWARQGNWQAYLKLRSQIFDFNDQGQHRVDIVKPVGLQDNILTVLVKGYFAELASKKYWLQEMANFIAIDTLGYLVDDEPIAGNPFSAALPYVLQHSVNEEADLVLIALLAKHVFHPGEDRDHQNVWHMAMRNKHLGRQTLEILYNNVAIRAHIRERLSSLDWRGDVLYEAISQLDKEKITFFLDPPLAMSLNKSHIVLLQNMQRRYRDYSAEGIRLASIIDSLRPILSFREGKSLTNEQIKATWFDSQCLNPRYFIRDNNKETQDQSIRSGVLEKLTGRNEKINKTWDKLIFQKTDVIIKTLLAGMQSILAKGPVIAIECKSISPLFLQYTEPEIREIFQVFTNGYRNFLTLGEKAEFCETQLQAVKRHWAIISASKLIPLILPRFCQDYLRGYPDYLVLRGALFPLFSGESLDYFNYACQRICALTNGAQVNMILNKHIAASIFADKLSDGIKLNHIHSALVLPQHLIESTEDSLEEMALNAMVKLLPDRDNLYQYFYHCLNVETLVLDFKKKYEFIFQYHADASPLLKSDVEVKPGEADNKVWPSLVADKKTDREMTLADKHRFLFASHLPGAADTHIEKIQKIVDSNYRKLFIEDFCSQLQLHVLPRVLKKDHHVSFKKLGIYVEPFFSSSYLSRTTLLSFSRHFKALFWDYPNDTCHWLARFLSEHLAQSLGDALGFSAGKYAENTVLATLRNQDILAESAVSGHRTQMRKILNRILYDTLLPFIKAQHIHAKVPDPSQEDNFLLALKRYIQQRLSPEKLADPLNQALSSTRIWRESKTVGYKSEEKTQTFALGMGRQEWAMRCQLMQQQFNRSQQLDVLPKLVAAAWASLSDELKEKLMNENLHLGLGKLISEGFSIQIAMQLLNTWQTESLSIIDDTCDIETAMNRVMEYGQEQKSLGGKFSPSLVKTIWEKIRSGSEWQPTLSQAQYHHVGVETITKWLKIVIVGDKQMPAQLNAAVLSYYFRSKPDLPFILEVARASHLSKIPPDMDALFAECLLKALAHTNHVTCTVSSRTISVDVHKP